MEFSAHFLKTTLGDHDSRFQMSIDKARKREKYVAAAPVRSGFKEQ